jgi:hypothetical protein
MDARLAALATAIAALELIIVRDAFSDRGVYAWSVLRAEYGILARPLGLVFGARGTLVLLFVQLAAAIALPVFAHPAPAWIAFGTSLAISIRWRGSYNGGSDAMLLVVLLAIAIGRTAPSLADAALAYAAVQLVLSYFVAGVAKLGDPAWRAGRALPILVSLPHYRVPPRAAALLAAPLAGRVLAYAMLAVECTFPLALLHPTVCIAYLAIGGCFHLVNAFVFGLNRFLWIWLAAYPALLHWASL